jgi:predicted RNase H-like HicB family nuclease
VLEYHAAYFHDIDSGWYTVEMLDFPGVLSQGRTLKSARRMIKDALRTMAEWYIEDGKALPRPDPRAKDKTAKFVAPIRIHIRVASFFDTLENDQGPSVSL